MSSVFSFDQIAQLVKKLKAVGWNTRQVTQLGQATPEQYADIEKILSRQPVVSVGRDTTHLRFLRNRALAQSQKRLETNQVFVGNLDPIFAAAAKRDSSAAKAVTTSIYKLENEGTYYELFSSISRDWTTLCLSPQQIMWFSTEHREYLHQDSHVNFFLIEYEGTPFVAFVHENGSSLKVEVRHFERRDLWSASKRPFLVVRKPSF